jgi:hypothetical protein
LVQSPLKISAANRQRAARIKLFLCVFRSGVSAERRQFLNQTVSGGLPTRRYGSHMIPSHH